MFWIFVSTKKIVSTLIAFCKHVADILSNFMWKNWSKTPFPEVQFHGLRSLRRVSEMYIMFCNVLYVYRSDSGQNNFAVLNYNNGWNNYVTFTCGTCGWVRIIMLVKKQSFYCLLAENFKSARWIKW